ncbi:ERMES complex subunit MMM1 [Aspergillus homomorphus CBS 101889]|uniref:Maintenance of mitochondrial morphology protein 1 n=1 Tax=Aspergillus homomorphus (strain CBS 101889) TaxID=1450537 RepID=A0A395HHT6_ASPHC|nr:maintenance of morphology protein [Aspergillus homomorphus CBS 101889]RAL07059.1 maintenance of morphology protein [Aspergillus homomorphus CBS 101889]
MSFQQPEPVPAQSSLSFTQGFLLGQLSVVLLIGAFIKFFIFGEAPPPPSRGLSHRASTHRRSNSIYNLNPNETNSRSLREKPSNSNVLRPVPSSSTNTQSILRKTYYSAIPPNLTAKQGRHRIHHSSHQPESLDWFNVLIAQTIAQYRQTAYLLKDSPTSSILSSLNAALNNPEKKPSFIDKIAVTDISLGEEFPIFSNCRIIAVDDPNSDGGRLQALMDVDLSDDNLSIAIETSLLLNYPKPCSAILPVALSVSVVRFSGTLCISLVPASTPPLHTPSPPSPPTADGTKNPGDGTQPPPTAAEEGDASLPKTGTPKSNVAFSFLPDYRLDLSVRSLIGSRSRLQDVPKVAQLVEARVHAWFEERVVEPRVQVVGLPDLWPRMGRTGVRTGEESETASNGASRGAMSDHLSAHEAEGLRFRGGLASRPQFDSVSRTSSYNVETGDLRSPSMVREESSGGLSDLHMPGSLEGQ